MTKTLSHAYNQNNKDKLVQNYGSSSNSPTKVRKMAKTGTQFFNKRHASTSLAYENNNSQSPSKTDNYGMSTIDYSHKKTYNRNKFANLTLKDSRRTS